ncbi:MAG: indole-3-glycerol phosphate synthase TrpC [Kiritimatiellia bacterium]|nr:indole-3-glycerol phosphate synthase TrpC [Kiritimatiellia bacterium]
MTRLDEIVRQRRADLPMEREGVSDAELRAAAAARVHRSLHAALRREARPRIIAEVKKRSPSAGLILDPYSPADVAAEYERSGAVAISVLTEPRYFGGRVEDLAAVRQRVRLPVLRKDFLFDPWQILQSAAGGADAVLLIVAALDPETCVSLYQEALRWGLEVIVETHEEPELETALRCPDAILGVNNRNLREMRTHLDISRRLAPLLPGSQLAISESGLKNGSDLAGLEALGFSGFLIGESLLRSGSPGDALARMIREAESRP